MKVYSIKEPIYGFYIYQLSGLTDPELVLEHYEHSLSIEDDNPLAKFLYDKWDEISVETAENLTARQYLDIVDKSGAGYELVKNDPKCINVSDEYQKFIVEKKRRGKKQPATSDVPLEAKPKPKPKGKGKGKMGVEIQGSSGIVDLNN